jgi:hypothetical protein
VHVEAQELPLSDPLRQALGPLADKARRFWEDLRPVGTARADIVLDLRPGGDPTPFELTLSHIRGTLLPLGLELDNDDGTFHYDGRRAEVHGLKSAIGAASLEFDDAVYDVATGVFDVRASVRGLHFPEDLEGPLTGKTIAAIVDVAPGRTVHASDVHLVYTPARDAAAAAVEITGALSVRPRTRRGLPDPGYAFQGLLTLDRFVLGLPADGPVSFEAQTRAEDFALRPGLAVDRLNGSVAMSGSLGGEPRIEMRIDDASFRVEGYPLSEVAARVVVAPQGTSVFLTKARFMGGSLDGRIGPGDDTVAYQGRFALSGGDLEQFLRLSAAPQQEVASGRVDVNVSLTNATGARADLRGKGEIDVTQGRLAPAPIATTLWNVVTVGIGGQPMLTEAKMKFDIEGDWLNVTKLEASGSGGAIENGTGKIAFDGRLDLIVSPRLDVPLPVIEQILKVFQTAVVPSFQITGTLRNPVVTPIIGPRTETERRREPPPAGDVHPPDRDPW